MMYFSQEVIGLVEMEAEKDDQRSTFFKAKPLRIDSMMVSHSNGSSVNIRSTPIGSQNWPMDL